MGVGIIAIVLIALVMARVARRDADKDVALQSGTKPRRSVMEPIWDLPTRSKLIIVIATIAIVTIVGNISYLPTAYSSRTSASSTSSSSGLSSSSSHGGYTETTTKATSIREYIYSDEMTGLRNTLHRVSDNLMELLYAGNSSEIQSRSSSLTYALKNFRSLDAPDECAALRDSYIQAANYTIYGLDAMYEAITISGNRTLAIEKATKNFKVATVSVGDALRELNELKKTY